MRVILCRGHENFTPVPSCSVLTASSRGICATPPQLLADRHGSGGCNRRYGSMTKDLTGALLAGRLQDVLLPVQVLVLLGQVCDLLCELGHLVLVGSSSTAWPDWLGLLSRSLQCSCQFGNLRVLAGIGSCSDCVGILGVLQRTLYIIHLVA